MIWSVGYTKAVLAVAGLGLGALAVSGYVAERERAIKAETVQQTQATIIKQAQDDRAQHVKEDATRDAATAAIIAQYQAEVAKQKTPVQIVGWSQSQLEQAIKGIQITVPAPTSENPHPSAAVTIPEISLPGLRDTIETCKICSVKLTAVQTDLISTKVQLKSADTQIDGYKKSLDEANQALKGGSTWTRVKHDGKLIAIGGAIAITVACALGHCPH